MSSLTQQYVQEIFGANGIMLDNNVRIDQLDLVNSSRERSLSFIDDVQYLAQLISNPHVVAVIATKGLKIEIEKNRSDLVVIEHNDPRWLFYTAYNYVGKKRKTFVNTVIDGSSKIHPRAYVAEKNVKIGKHCVIHPNVTILEDVEIGDYCVIQAGTVIGSEGFEYKKTSQGVLGVYHDGKVIVGNYVEIGANTCVDKGFAFRDTVIDDHVKIDNLVYVAHCVHIGQGSFIIAGAMLMGSSTVGKNVWVGPNASISHVKLADSSFVTLGSVVVRDVEENQMVSGNWAVPHNDFIAIFKRNLKNIKET
jgi:UDP-3-O-[3-hydroxymyristoyl] glucosamine N-acyltransferase